MKEMSQFTFHDKIQTSEPESLANARYSLPCSHFQSFLLLFSLPYGALHIKTTLNFFKISILPLAFAHAITFAWDVLITLQDILQILAQMSPLKTSTPRSSQEH